MTTLATVTGTLPIAACLEAGVELRQPFGLAVVGEVLFSQVITLYITRAIYLYLDRWSGAGPLRLRHDPVHVPATRTTTTTPKEKTA